MIVEVEAEVIRHAQEVDRIHGIVAVGKVSKLYFQLELTFL